MAQGDELELSADGRRIAVFDVDGTLTETHEADEAWYRLAIREVLGVEGFSTDWAGYRHSTDRAIVREIGERHRGLAATHAEGDAVLAAYARHLERAAAEGSVAAVEGAREVLPSLRTAGWDVAIATGGWGSTARRKLDAARIGWDGVAFASCDDADAREEIIRLAVARAVGGARAASCRVVYVGDGRWDLRAARRLGIGFVGVGRRERAAELRAAGAEAVTCGYRDVAAFVRLLDCAAHAGQAEHAGQAGENAPQGDRQTWVP